MKLNRGWLILTIRNDRNPGCSSSRPRPEDLANVALVLNGHIETFRAAPDVRVIGAGIPNLERM